MMNLINLAILWLTELKNRLFVTYSRENTHEKEPLTKLSIAIIILLDFFLFGLVYNGISEQSRIIKTPEHYASYRCRTTIENFQKINEPEIRETVAQNLYTDSNYSRSGKGMSSYSYDYNYSYSSDATSDDALECKNIGVILTKASTDGGLEDLYKNRSEISEKIAENLKQTNSLRSGYDTKLLEKIADQNPDLAIDPGTATTTKLNLDRLAEEKVKLDADLAKNTTMILANPQVMEIASLVNSRGAYVLETYANKVFWYPVKTLAVEVLFLIPLLLVVAFWSNRSLTRNRPYQLLIASHLLVILGIFIVLKLFEFIYDIIPHKLIEDFINWLASIQLVGIWYYLLILCSVSITLGIVYFIQRRVKIAAENKKAEIGAKRAEKGECWACGAHLLIGAEHCIRCGKAQNRICHSCEKSTPLAAEHCAHCGVERQ